MNPNYDLDRLIYLEKYWGVNIANFIANSSRYSDGQKERYFTEKYNQMLEQNMVLAGKAPA